MAEAVRNDPDESPHNVAFHDVLHYLLRQDQSSEEEMQYVLEIMTSDPAVYTTNQLDLLYIALWKYHWSEKGLPLKRHLLFAAYDSFKFCWCFKNNK